MTNKLLKKGLSSKLRARNYRENKKLRSSLNFNDNESECEKVEELETGEVVNEDVGTDYVQADEFIEVKESDEEYSDNNGNRFSSNDEDDNNSDCSDNDEVNDDEVIMSDITKDLRLWARESLIPYVHVDSLLKVLKRYHPELPCSHKTLFKKSSNNTFKVEKFNSENPFDTSQYLYCEIEKQLQRTVDTSLQNSSVLNLQFHVDGLPLYRSSPKEFWLILGKLYSPNKLDKPFVIAVWCGNGKPSNIELYLKRFVEEINYLLEKGIQIEEKHFTIFVMKNRPLKASEKIITLSNFTETHGYEFPMKTVIEFRTFDAAIIGNLYEDLVSINFFLNHLKFLFY